MKFRSRFLASLLSCLLVLSMVGTSSSAYEVSAVSPIEPSQVVTSGIMPMQVGDYIYFKLGSFGYLKNCGNAPRFRVWATGGSSNTDLKISVVTAGGVSYTMGTVTADSKHYLEKQYFVLNGTGTWQFAATVVSGSNNDMIYVHVEQY